MTGTFSRRVPFEAESNPLFARRAARAAAGLPFADLVELNPTRVGIEYPEPEIREILARGAGSAYDPDPRGPTPAREAVARDFARRGIEIPPDGILLAASTSEAFGLLFKVLCDPGDAVLVPRPGYPLLDHLASLEGVAAESYDFEEDGSFRIDPSPRVRAAVVVAPHAPTGLGVRDFASPIPVILDEVFADYADEPAPRVDAPLVFRLGGLSKTAGLPGLKGAWVGVEGAAPAAREALARLETAADATLSLHATTARAMGDLLGLAPRIRARLRARIGENLALLGTSRLAPTLTGTGAAWTIQFRLDPARDDEAAALSILDRGFFLHPGYLYDFPESGPRLLASLLTPPDLLRGAVPTLAASL